MASNPHYPELTEDERFPILTQRGRHLLHRLRQHANAPNWNWPNGEQLDQDGLECVTKFAQSLAAFHHQASSATHELDKPAWLENFVERCLREVPFYRQRCHASSTSQMSDFEALPTCRRANLAPRVWEFVPDSQSLDQVIVFSSSGTTGYPTRTPHHPYSAACGVPLMEQALRAVCGIELPRGADQVAIANVAAYPGAYTTAIVVAYLQEAGCLRINLDRSAWRQPEDITSYINAWHAPIWLGDPIAYGAMERLSIDYAPQAILSSIMHITDAYAQQLSARYGCPVLDLYAMTEAGIISVGTTHGHRILPHDLYVEILDQHDQPCPAGIRGEVTLTGGRNPFLPLLRYRTGDFASLAHIDGHRLLVGLEGRQPIEYPTTDGPIVHSMELTRLMRRYPVLRYELRSRGELDYQLEYVGDIDHVALNSELVELFGSSIGVLKIDRGSCIAENRG